MSNKLKYLAALLFLDNKIKFSKSISTNMKDDQKKEMELQKGASQ